MEKAGRALDLVIAERVMGWHWLTGQHWDVTRPEGEQRWLLPPDMGINDVGGGEWNYYVDSAPEPDGRFTLYDVPRYSTNMGAAWEVVEAILDLDGKFGDYKMTFGMEFSQIVDWVVEFVPGRNHRLAREYGDSALRTSGMTAPHAVCLAALRLLDVL